MPNIRYLDLSHSGTEKMYFKTVLKDRDVIIPVIFPSLKKKKNKISTTPNLDFLF